MLSGPNGFVWYELMTTDISAAKAFYGAVLGWTVEPWGPPEIGYAIASISGTPVAGVMPLPEGIRARGGPPAWLGYIGTPDVDAATERLRQAGGAVNHAPADIPEVGRFSVVADPHGAVFMLFTPRDGDQAPVPPGTPGHVGWHELHAGNGEEAFGFYSGQFGWTKDQAIDMGPMGTYQLFAAGGPAIGGMMTKTPNMPVPAWLYYFNVAALDEGAAKVTGNGGQVLFGPMQVPGGSWIIQAMDPQGAMFALVAPTR
jgi:uncharacterized protein